MNEVVVKKEKRLPTANPLVFFLVPLVTIFVNFMVALVARVIALVASVVALVAPVVALVARVMTLTDRSPFGPRIAVCLVAIVPPGVVSKIVRSSTDKRQETDFFLMSLVNVGNVVVKTPGLRPNNAGNPAQQHGLRFVL